eukprot:4603868-Pleurochrysis_carterae.AAC.1
MSDATLSHTLSPRHPLCAAHCLRPFVSPLRTLVPAVFSMLRNPEENLQIACTGKCMVAKS